jgi:hypothetical protein
MWTYVYLVPHHHWVLGTSVFPDERQKLQLALWILLRAYTATRLAALVYRPADRKKAERALHLLMLTKWTWIGR